MHPFRTSRSTARGGASSAHGVASRRLIAPLAALAAAVLLCAPGLARADSSSSLTVVGTSDVSDSGLIQHVIQPAFNAAYPQYTFKYIGTATGTAITDAETGSVGASALIVHAASLENQFVAGGYSYEAYGRALWTNDFVLAGPTADPAGVHANASDNVAQAFADVAAAGIAGTAEFISRGGTPGTTVEEHQIWALVARSNLEPAGLVLCTVNAANGGGETPIAASAGVADGQPCPNGGALPTGSQLPGWYAATGLTQGPNVLSANACNGYSSGANSCYVLTDRGTYDYLASRTDPAGTIPSLTVLTENDSATAPGGQYALVNYFHGYIINPSKPGQTVNLTAAQDFLNLITSPPVQAAVAAYLNSSAGGAPFTPSASPLITTKKRLPSKYTDSGPLTITGTVANAQVGYPAPNGVRVTLDRVSGDLTLPVASAKTNAKGAFTIKTELPTKGSYVLSTPQFSQVENATLSPPFGDTLSPAETSPTSITVRGAISGLRASSLGAGALVTGQVGPSSGHVSGRVTVYARRLGVKHAGYRRVATANLGTDDGRFAALARLRPGRWQIRAFFSDRGTVLTSRARATTVTVAAAATAHIAGAGGSLSKNGTLTTRVRIFPTATSGAKVSLVVAKLSASGTPRRSTLDTVKVHPGARSVTLHGRLKGSGHWAVLESYQAPGRGIAWTRTVGHVTIRAKTSTKQK
jgi:tungstate transport system substrate-binding protein